MEESDFDSEDLETVESVGENKLTYSISACSSYSSSYRPHNIMENKPRDQASRWSSDTNSPPQYIILKLDKPAIVTGIKFGKYEKTHVCNLKRFKVYGSWVDNDKSFIQLLDSGLKNDHVSESFSVKHQLNGHYFPSNYIKIVPIQSWGPSFNFSIWYVGLLGDDSPKLVESCLRQQKELRERETIRLCLKHFREQNYLEAFESLEKRTKIQLEHPLLTSLHNILVKNGDYPATEELVINCLGDGTFSQFISQQQPKPVWLPLIQPDNCPYLSPPPPTPPQIPNSTDSPTTESEALGEDSQVQGKPPHPLIPSTPPARGGHQLVLDNAGQTIYLFGGWDGTQDLADFWAYHIPSNRWTQLSPNTEEEGGPPPRSCHKMVLDPSYRQLFVLGRYVERTLRDSVSNIRSDFHLYDIGTGKWTQITDDTAAMGGPGLIFDHQMCLDNEKRNIYVFGGQSLYMTSSSGGVGEERPTSDKKFSGLYSYHIPTNSWRCIWVDGEIKAEGPVVRSRTGHSMLFNTEDRNLYIFGGQRKRDEYLNDFFTFNVDTETVKFLSKGLNNSDSAIPAVGYTQRSSIDCRRAEIHVMTGLNKDKQDKDRRSTDTKVSNSFWIYDIRQKRWSCIYKNENKSARYWNTKQSVEPRPRYAHQLVYSQETETHYIFGGNPGGREGKEGKLRLGDFWKLNLVRPATSDLERHCRLTIRTARFQELCRDPMTALSYLQSEITQCVDHENEQEEKVFQQLPAQVFSQENSVTNHKVRSDLFNSLVNFFPREMTQPTGNLLDLIPLEVDAPSTSVVINSEDLASDLD